jgi:plastocyanin
MKHPSLSWSTAALLAVAGAVLVPVLLSADDNKSGPVAGTVSFGAGLNTAQPGNSANHHVLPGMIHVQAGGVVNFNVAGFHQIYVYNPGKRPEDVHPADPTALFMDDKVGLYYEGLKTGGGPPPGIPVTTNPSNAANRLESVSFSKPGTYLVICNVAPHFADGMWAWIHVTGNDN